MKILHLSTLGEGGAANAAYRLHKGLQQIGCTSEMLVAHRRNSDPCIAEFLPPMTPMTRVVRRFRRCAISQDLAKYRGALGPASIGKFGDDRSHFRRDLIKQLPACNVVNLHWVVGFVDYGSFFRSAPARTPVVWTLHDMNPFTGGCHYDYGCGKFTAQCGRCPQLGSEDSVDLSSNIWRRKLLALASVPAERFRIVAPSAWMAAEAKRSSLFGRFEIATIPYGLDTDDFAPRDRLQAKAILGIRAKHKVVLFVAAHIADPRKGYRYVAEAVDQLKLNDVVFAVIGDGKLPFHPRMRSFHVRNLDTRGVVETGAERRLMFERFLSLAYSAADVCVAPSTAENLAQTVMEAMACGVPVVAFNVGGMPDLVQPRVTGDLVAPGDVRGMAEAIRVVLTDDTGRRQMGMNCRERIQREFTLEIQARRYLSLYESLL